MVANDYLFLKEKSYIAVSLTHFFIDVLNNGRNLLIAILAITLGLTNAQVGIVLLIYNIGNAICQPFFWLIGRSGGGPMAYCGRHGLDDIFLHDSRCLHGLDCFGSHDHSQSGVRHVSPVWHKIGLTNTGTGA